ncbi:hypothetical protein [Janthinobacterium fluminis]|uniref:CPBP family intramembrane metalloprotease n=1 Tax=Janthinobacterium fluminis TaxID=2987524 RepID=A0ABT5K5M6_9BURK|nr:hypothetical protein [Janthinobacterium fluminis]MDC8760086.1 hypothetical protein [Janthinobacterium fluminis]
MQRLRHFLFSPPSTTLLRHSFSSFLLAIIPSLALATIVYVAIGLIGGDNRHANIPATSTNGLEFFVVVVFSPAVESLLLALTLAILSIPIKNRPGAAMAAALIWGVLHGLTAPIWFFGTVWSFFIFSAAYLTWRKHSFKSAFIATALPHALVNLTSFLFQAFVTNRIG